MSHEDVIEGVSPGRGHGNTTSEVWGAREALSKSAGLYKKGANNEVTPLLGSGSGSGSGSDSGHNSVREQEWEGFADFDGVAWWRRPAVSI